MLLDQSGDNLSIVGNRYRGKVARRAQSDERGRWRDSHQVRGDVGVLIDLPEGGGEAE